MNVRGPKRGASHTRRCREVENSLLSTSMMRATREQKLILCFDSRLACPSPATSMRSGRCEVDDVKRVRYFTRHGVPRPGKACMISARPPQPQGLLRPLQWRGRQGPRGAFQGSSRTSAGRPQPHTKGATPHTNLSRSSTPDRFPSERSINKNMQCHHTNSNTYDLRKGRLSLGDCRSTLHTDLSTPGIIAANRSKSRHRDSVQSSPRTISPKGLMPFRPPSCRGF